MNKHVAMTRRGAAVLVVLVVLMLLGVAVSLALRANLAARAESRRAAARLQAEFLATGGLELAAARLGGDANYAGETWNVAANELGGSESAEVSIEVAMDASHPGDRQITVLAVYPAGGDAWRQQRLRRSFSWSPSHTLGTPTP